MGGNPLLWFIWFAFGTYLAVVVWKLVWPAARTAELPTPKVSILPTAPPAWLWCESGAALDRRVGWFELSKSADNIVGHRPRTNTVEQYFVFLAADDVRDEHFAIRFTPSQLRYQLRRLEGTLNHNGEEVSAPTARDLYDGDVLEFGRTRLRFSLSGPEPTG